MKIMICFRSFSSGPISRPLGPREFRGPAVPIILTVCFRDNVRAVGIDSRGSRGSTLRRAEWCSGSVKSFNRTWLFGMFQPLFHPRLRHSLGSLGDALRQAGLLSAHEQDFEEYPSGIGEGCWGCLGIDDRAA